LINRSSRWCLLPAGKHVLLPVNQDAEVQARHQRWGLSSPVLDLPFRKVAALIERGKGWPWNGYELKKMKPVGKYPPKPQNAVVHDG